VGALFEHGEVEARLVAAAGAEVERVLVVGGFAPA
jgi:hypothetical protein